MGSNTGTKSAVPVVVSLFKSKMFLAEVKGERERGLRSVRSRGTLIISPREAAPKNTGGKVPARHILHYSA